MVFELGGSDISFQVQTFEFEGSDFSLEFLKYYHNLTKKNCIKVSIFEFF